MVTSVNTDLLAARAATEDKALRTLINANQSDLSALTTTEKASIVGAVNEVNAALGNLSVINDAGTGTNDIWSASKISAELTAQLDGLVSGAPGTLDTITEIATALQDNPDVITALQNQQAANATAIAANTVLAQQGVDDAATAQTTADQGVTDAAAAQASANTGIAAAATAQAAANTAQTDATQGITDAAAAQATADANAVNLGDPAADFVATFNANLV